MGDGTTERSQHREGSARKKSVRVEAVRGGGSAGMRQCGEEAAWGGGSAGRRQHGEEAAWGSGSVGCRQRGGSQCGEEAVWERVRVGRWKRGEEAVRGAGSTGRRHLLLLSSLIMLKASPDGSWPTCSCTLAAPFSFSASAYVRGLDVDCRQNGTCVSPILCLQAQLTVATAHARGTRSRLHRRRVAGVHVRAVVYNDSE